MMFKNILSLWKCKNFLEQTLDEFKEMLDNSENMYKIVSRVLLHGEDAAGVKEEIYSLDRTINRLEKSIRKRIVEHLVIQPTVDVSTCLILMSVVKDAERLGDYCKNLYEVTTLVDSQLDASRFTELFNGMEDELAEFFANTKRAFIESDEELARKAWEYKDKISKRCDNAIESLAKSDTKTNEAVCLTLIARHFKRLSSHLANIATSVILPIDKLDYFDEKK